MAVRKRGKIWHYQFEVDGRPYAATTGLAATKRNRNAAEAMEAEHRRAIREGRAHRRELTARLFSDAAQEYFKWAASEHRDHPSTARRIRVSFASLLPAFDGMMVAGVGQASVERYKVMRKAPEKEGGHAVEDVTLRHDLHALSGFFRWAIRMNYATDNPVSHVAIPSDKDAVRTKVLTDAEERAYFAAAQLDTLLYDFARLMLQQGMRPGELLSITAADVDLVGGTLAIRESKTAAGRRTLSLTPRSRSILARRCNALPPAARVFKVTPSGLAKRHALARRASRTDFVLYTLRHTFASRAAALGIPITTLAGLLGHASLRLLARYVHPQQAELKAAMALIGSVQADSTEAIQ